jgi:hypothetical protein
MFKTTDQYLCIMHFKTADEIIHEVFTGQSQIFYYERSYTLKKQMEMNSNDEKEQTGLFDFPPQTRVTKAEPPARFPCQLFILISQN